jgi:signal peptidase I
VRRLRANAVLDLVLLVGMVFAVLFVVQLWVIKPFKIPSPSMVPTLAVGDRIFAARFWYHLTDPARGDIVVFHPNGSGSGVYRSNTASDEVYVKRLIGLPGEVVGSHQGRVWVCANDREPTSLDAPTETPGCRFLDEPYTHGKATAQCPPGARDLEPIHVDRGRYLMLGDNRIESDDGRCWGLIHRSQIIGKVVMTYWPLDRVSFG